MISNDQAVRFEQSPGFYHYAAVCRTAKEFTTQMPPPRLPLDATEMAVCWYAKGSRAGGGTTSPEADGKLVVSAHHVRFMPHSPQFAGLYADLHPEQVELKHDPGQPYATLRSGDLVFTFRFSKLCPECAPGTPVTPGFNPALLDQEFGLLDAGIRNFDSGWRQVYRLIAGKQAAPAAPRQAAASAPAAGAPASPVERTIKAQKPRVSAAANSEVTASAPAVASTVTKPATAPVSNAATAGSTRPAASAGRASSAAGVGADPSASSAASMRASAPVVTAPLRVKPVRIASKTADGRLIKKIPPEYPLEAKLVRLEGTVVLRAVIDRSGDVSEVFALSGPPLLESAAVDAVKQWQYRPFSVNGQPVDVETTIDVSFALDGSHAVPRAQNSPK